MDNDTATVITLLILILLKLMGVSNFVIIIAGAVMFALEIISIVLKHYTD